MAGRGHAPEIDIRWNATGMVTPRGSQSWARNDECTMNDEPCWRPTLPYYTCGEEAPWGALGVRPPTSPIDEMLTELRRRRALIRGTVPTFAPWRRAGCARC